MEDGATKKRKAMALCVQDESSLRWKFIKWTLAVIFYKAPGSSPFPSKMLTLGPFLLSSSQCSLGARSWYHRKPAFAFLV